MENANKNSNKKSYFFVYSFFGLIIVSLVAILAWFFVPMSQQTTKNTPVINKPSFTPTYEGNPTLQRPTVQQQTDDQNSSKAFKTNTGLEKTHQPEVTTAASPKTNTKINPETGLPVDKNNPEILSQRKHVMLQLSEIITQTSQGVAPNKQRVISLANELKSIYKLGYLSKDDAINTLSFLKHADASLKNDIDKIIAELNTL